VKEEPAARMRRALSWQACSPPSEFWDVESDNTARWTHVLARA
jgi:hypothetical protein